MYACTSHTNIVSKHHDRSVHDCTKKPYALRIYVPIAALAGPFMLKKKFQSEKLTLVFFGLGCASSDRTGGADQDTDTVFDELWYNLNDRVIASSSTKWMANR